MGLNSQQKTKKQAAAWIVSHILSSSPLFSCSPFAPISSSCLWDALVSRVLLSAPSKYSFLLVFCHPQTLGGGGAGGLAGFLILVHFCFTHKEMGKLLSL